MIHATLHFKNYGAYAFIKLFVCSIPTENFQRERSLKRQDRVERYREAMPDLIEKRKQKEAQVWEIVKRVSEEMLQR